MPADKQVLNIVTHSLPASHTPVITQERHYDGGKPDSESISEGKFFSTTTLCTVFRSGYPPQFGWQQPGEVGDGYLQKATCGSPVDVSSLCHYRTLSCDRRFYNHLILLFKPITFNIRIKQPRERIGCRNPYRARDRNRTNDIFFS